MCRLTPLEVPHEISVENFVLSVFLYTFAADLAMTTYEDNHQIPFGTVRAVHDADHVCIGTR